jgi:hypothetical protein
MICTTKWNFIVLHLFFTIKRIVQKVFLCQFPFSFPQCSVRFAITKQEADLPTIIPCRMGSTVMTTNQVTGPSKLCSLLIHFSN